MFLMFMHSFEEEYEDERRKRNLKIYKEALQKIANIHVNSVMSSIDIARAALRKAEEK